MKRTPEQSAKVAAWLNMLDHCEAQLQGLGALKNPVKGRGPCMADRVRLLKSELSEAQEQVATLSHNLETVIEAGKARKARAAARGRESKATIAGLRREVARRAEASTRAADLAHANDSLAQYSEARRLELLALAQMLDCDCVPHKMLEAVKTLQVAASAEGNECVRVRLPRNGETHISIDGETWYEQKTGRKV